MKKRLYFCSLIFAITLTSMTAHATNNQLISGAGPSTKVVQLFFDNFSKHPAAQGYSFAVPPISVKHKGGIQSSDNYLFGRTGRPLNEMESNLGKNEIFLAKVPITFAVGLEVKVKTLTMVEIEKIFRKETTNWKHLGGPDADILLVGRENTEALFTVLKSDYPFFTNVTFDQIFKKDHEVVKFLTSPAGRYAIGFGAKPNFSAFNQVSTPDLSSGVSLGLVYDQKNSDNSVIKAVKTYAASKDWKTQVEQIGLLPAD